MSISIILLLVAAGALILPNLGGGDDDDDTEGRNEILGGPGEDEINGTNGPDLIRTFLGNDEINGGGGNDEIRAGDGNDTVFGGAGLDFIRGGDGDDIIEGNEGNDRIIADRGNDTVDAGLGSDVVRGGQGNDIIRGGINAEIDGLGNPIGNFGATDQLSGEGGDDTIYAWGGDSTIVGGGQVPSDQSDDDTLIAVTGKVFMTNGPGENTDIVLANAQDAQGTFATITDFNLEQDALIMTVDYASDNSDVGDLASLDFELSFRDNELGDERGTGVFVDIRLVGVEDETADQLETSRVFLEGFSVAGIEGSGTGLDVQVYLTEDASYVDPDSTIASFTT